MSERYVFFTNECVGLGHFRRALLLATAVVERDPAATCLIITGTSPTGDQPLPHGVDVVKLPSLARNAEGNHAARRLGVDLADVVRIRTAIAAAATDAFRPTVAVIDKTPLGLHNELAGVLATLRRRGCRVALGLRDVDDSPERVRRAWNTDAVRNAIERFYDLILIYGDAGGNDTLTLLGWTDLPLDVHAVGFVGADLPPGGAADLTAPYVLVTAGGGADGAPVFETYLDAVRERPLPVASVLVTGPLMSAEDGDRVRARAVGVDAEVFDFRPDMTAVTAGAHAVVSMAGYNTVSEALRSGAPLLLIPRVRPSREQLIRAETLARRGRASMLHPDTMTPATMRAALDTLLGEPRRPLLAEAGGARLAAEVLAAPGWGRRPSLTAAAAAA